MRPSASATRATGRLVQDGEERTGQHDADDGEDKISKKARLEQLEPMEVAHYYTERYHRAMDELNVLSPSIEPCASGHIIEQIAW